MKSLILLCVCLFLTACGATTPTKTAYDNYLTYLEAGEFQKARLSLENEINNPDTPYGRPDLITVMVYKLLSGGFGYYDIDGFKYWYKRLGDDASVGIRHYYMDLQKIEAYIETNPQGAKEYLAGAIKACDGANPMLMAPVDASEKAFPLQLLHVQDCMLDKLDSSEAARKAYHFYLVHFSSRDNSASKARGVELFDQQDMNLIDLSVADRSALLNFWAQIIKADMPSRRKLAVPHGLERETVNVFEVYMESTNTEDWKLVAQQVDKNAKEGSLELQVYLYNSLVGLLAVNDMYSMFDQYLDVYASLVSPNDENLLNYQHMQLWNRTESGDALDALAKAKRLHAQLQEYKKQQALSE